MVKGVNKSWRNVYEQTEQSHKGYYLIGIVIVAAILAYLTLPYLQFGGEYTENEQLCLERLAASDSSVISAKLLDFEQTNTRYEVSNSVSGDSFQRKAVLVNYDGSKIRDCRIEVLSLDPVPKFSTSFLCDGDEFSYEADGDKLYYAYSSKVNGVYALKYVYFMPGYADEYETYKSETISENIFGKRCERE